jgi:antitoxin (DNA-binding transcriptional repressor) of toxin-antitoxin stability system
MRAVALKTLQTRLTEYVHLAQEGETVLVTEQDRVIARLVPPLEERGAGLDQTGLAAAIQKGWISPSPRRRHGPPPRVPVASWGELARELDEDRSDR